MAQLDASIMNTRPIPSSGEALPVVGLGTYLAFDAAPGTPAYAGLPAVLDALFAGGGTVVDSSPMYGRAEETVGELLAARATPPAPFLATKVWTPGRAAGLQQMETSFRLLRAARIDLLQIHNLVDWRTHLPTLRQWKETGRIRYVGLTHYVASAHREVETVLRAEPFDTLQINYSIDEREVEARVLPAAQDRGVAVIVNRPFGAGALLRRLRDRPLPGWAPDLGYTTWAQLALAFVLGHPAVTCVIPGTSSARNMAENAAVGLRPPLSAAQRAALVTLAG